MSVTDLVGSGRGDVTGLGALASRLRRAALALTSDDSDADTDAVLQAAAAVEAAADRLRALTLPPTPGAVLEVEAALVADLAAPLTVLTREGDH